MYKGKFNFSIEGEMDLNTHSPVGFDISKPIAKVETYEENPKSSDQVIFSANIEVFETFRIIALKMKVCIYLIRCLFHLLEKVK